MRLSTQSRYGVRAIFDMVYNTRGMEGQVKDISRRQGISPRYLEQIFQKLKKAGILGSKRGPAGGYFLYKKPEAITVADIIQITEGTLNPFLCHPFKRSDKPCPRIDGCVTQLVWEEAAKRLGDYFRSVSIQDLCVMAQAKGIQKELEERI